ncbi:hypothetical protein VPHD479_0202 [Vibrio phage D479]
MAKTFDQYIAEVAVNIAQLYRILDELGGTSVYDPAADIAAGFNADKAGTVQKIIDLVTKSKEDTGYTVANLKSFQRRI